MPRWMLPLLAVRLLAGCGDGGGLNDFDLYLKRERGARERLLAVGERVRVRLDTDL